MVFEDVSFSEELREHRLVRLDWLGVGLGEFGIRR